jgi:hypothetical protein
MSTLCAHSRLRTAIAAAGVLVFLTFVETRGALAACGDWLDHSARPAVHDATANGKVAGQVDREQQSHQPAVPCPCRGPQCQKMPAGPAPAAPVLPTVELGKFVTRDAAGSHPGDDASRVALLWLSAAEPSSGYPTRIDHPPRVNRAKFGG